MLPLLQLGIIIIRIDLGLSRNYAMQPFPLLSPITVVLGRNAIEDRYGFILYQNKVGWQSSHSD